MANDEKREQPKLYLLPEDLRNDLLGYLVQRPYAEVALGVKRLEALAPVPPIAAVPAAAPEG